MFWFTNKKINFLVHTLNESPGQGLDELYTLFSLPIVPSLLVYTEYRGIYRCRYSLKLEIGLLAPLGLRGRGLWWMQMIWVVKHIAIFLTD